MPPMFTAKLTGIRRTAVIGLGLAVLTAALYWPTLHHGFIAYDDDAYIVSNPHVNAGVTWPGIVWAWQSTYAANWHPLTWISHMLDCQLYGVSPAGHHFTNLLFHVVNTLLLFVWLSRATGAVWRSAFVAALFAWHPTHIESVAWAAERKDVLSACFWMLTLLAYTRYTERSKVKSPRSKVYYGLSLLAFAGGLMSKPMVVTLPFVLLLLDFWPLDRIPNFDFRRANFAKLLGEKVPFFLLAFAASAVTFFVQRTGGAFWSLENLPFSARIANALAAYLGYISKTFWPANLALIYPHPHHWPLLLTLSSALLLLFWTALSLWRAREHPYLFTGWFWFLGTLVPVIGLVQVGVQSMADRYLYLPSIGLFITIVWSISELFPHPPQRKLLAVLGAIALTGCLAVASLQLRYWQNSVKLFLHAVAVTTENYAAEVCLGEALENGGHSREALALYADAVRIEPDYPLAQSKLGLLLLASGQPAEASNHLALAAGLMPHHPDVQYDFGLFLRSYGSPADAADRFRTALAVRPDFPGALNDLAWILATADDPKLRSGPEAVRLAERACELTQYRQAALLTTLSAAYAEAGQYSNAVATVQKSLDFATNDGQTNIVAQDEALLKLYQTGKPGREMR